jgi:hypothetical protein
MSEKKDNNLHDQSFIDKLLNFIINYECILVLLKDLSGNPLTIESIWRRCNGHLLNKNKNFFQISGSDGFTFIVNTANKDIKLLIYILNQWVGMIHSLWPHINNFFSDYGWKIILAQYIIGKNSNINTNLYPSIEYLHSIAKENSQKPTNDLWDKSFNLLIAKRNLLKLEFDLLSYFNKQNYFLKDIKSDQLSIDKVNINHIYRIFLNNAVFIQSLLNQKSIYSDAISYIDNDFFSKISALPDIEFLGVVCENINNLKEKVDSIINSLIIADK